jgi:hypothetical protein
VPFEGFKADFAWLDHENRFARYAAGIGRENRRTIGVRVFGASDGWDADGQVSYQYGSFAVPAHPALTISAWGAAFEGGRTFLLPWSPRFAMRLDAAGGDGRVGDHVLGTFDLPYPNLSYLTDAAIFAPRNVHDIQPFVAVAPFADLMLTAGTQFLWRNSTQDAVYSPVNLPVIGPGGRQTYVATEPYLRVDWRVNPLAEWQLGVIEAVPGAALRDAGGRKTLSFVFSSIALRV